MEVDEQSYRDWALSSETYREEKGLHPRKQAKWLDRILGFKIPKIEVKLQQKYRAYYRDNDELSRKQHYEGTQTWIGLHPQVLQTPYSQIHQCLTFLKEENIESVVDIGAGYGRIGIVSKSFFPNVSFRGYEILKKRADEGNRIFEKFEMNDCVMINENVLDDGFVLPKAQIYFIYDFSEREDISKVLDQLVERVESYNFFLITKGERVDFLIEKKYKKFWNSNGFKKINDLTIYSSRKSLSKR